MSTRRFRVLALVGLLLTGLLAEVLHIVGSGSPRNTFLFPDGLRLTVVGTSRGDENFMTEKGWQRAARKLLPQRWQGWLPEPRRVLSQGGSNTLVVWVTLVPGWGTSVIPATFGYSESVPLLQRVPWSYCLSVANDGARFAAADGPPLERLGYSGLRYFVPAVLDTNGVHLYSVQCATFPRQEAEFELEFQDTNHAVLGTVRVRNPFR